MYHFQIQFYINTTTFRWKIQDKEEGFGFVLVETTAKLFLPAKQLLLLLLPHQTQRVLHNKINKLNIYCFFLLITVQTTFNQ